MSDAAPTASVTSSAADLHPGHTSALPPPARRPGTYRMLDAWRGIASLAVVCFHWQELAVRHTPELGKNLWYVLSIYGNMGVQIFFVISGYCIANAAALHLERGQSIERYLIARARRIYPTYWAGLALSLAFAYAGFLLAKRGVVADNIFTHANPLLQPVGVYLSNLSLTMLLTGSPTLLMVAWTLCYEVGFYVVVAVAMQFSRKADTMLRVLHGVTVIGLLWMILSPNTCPLPLNLWPQFGIGVVVYDLLTETRPQHHLEPTRWSQWERTLWAVAIACLTLTFVVVSPMGASVYIPSIRLAFGIALAFGVVLIVLRRWDTAIAALPPVRVLGWVGIFSYSLYLTHTVTIRILGQVLERVNLPPAFHGLAFLLAVLTAIGAAYGFFWLFEKPFLRQNKRKAEIKPVPSVEVSRVEALPVVPEKAA